MAQAAQMQAPAQQSMAQQKVAAYLNMAQKSESLWNGVLVFLGTLMLISSIPFYPIYLTLALAAVCGAVATRAPPIGLIIGAILALPALIYQSPIMALFYIFILVSILIQAFEMWKIIAALEILVMAPFAFGGLPFAGWISIIGMAFGSLYFGSKKSAIISVFSVCLILLLSSTLLVQNTAYMPIKMDLYQPGKPELQFLKKDVGPGQLAGALMGAISTFDFGPTFDSMALIADNFFRLLLGDSLILQLLGWGVSLYLVGYLPSVLKPRPQLMGALALLILLPVYFLVSMFYGTAFRLEFAAGIVLSIALLGGLEQYGVNVSRESEIQRSEKMKAYGKFGMADMSLGGEERSMADVGGYEDVKQELRDAIIMPLEKKEIAFTYGIKPPTGILLFGPPGTGKTMLMRALAKELKYNFIEVKCSQILSQWYGESEKNVAEVFDNARKQAPTVLFFDEIDAVAKRRSAESLDEVGQRVLSELLQQIDGASKSKATVMIVGATNRPDSIDTAMLRPGRLDKIIYMHLPDPEARKAIFRVSLRELASKGAVSPDINYDELARKTERFSGADVKNIVQEVKRLAAKAATVSGRVVPLSMEHFLQVIGYVKPSTSLAMLDMYEQFKLDFERRVGAEKPKAEEAEKETAVHWTDVAGLDQVKQALLEAIELPLLHEAEMKEFKVKPSKGILLFGPPGTGKTLIVKAAANELKASFQALSAAEVMKKGYTQAVTVIKEAFNRARENPPGIIFVDEIETFAPARGAGGSAEILGQFLTEMDGIKGKQGVVVMAATNKPALMDPAIMRPGRFDKIFYIPPPDEKGRVDMFKIHLGKFAEGVDLAMLASLTPGFSGADIAEICQTAKMQSLRAKLAGKVEPVTTASIAAIIKTRRPSVTNQILDEYRRFLEAYGERR
ncbi:MAG: AAA family ATPase [Candidatus Micrarchaeota archaeon]